MLPLAYLPACEWIKSGVCYVSYVKSVKAGLPLARRGAADRIAPVSPGGSRDATVANV